MKSVKGDIYKRDETDDRLVAFSGEVMMTVDAAVSGALLVTELRVEVYDAVRVAVMEEA